MGPTAAMDEFYEGGGNHVVVEQEYRGVRMIGKVDAGWLNAFCKELGQARLRAEERSRRELGLLVTEFGVEFARIVAQHRPDQDSDSEDDEIFLKHNVFPWTSGPARLWCSEITGDMVGDENFRQREKVERRKAHVLYYRADELFELGMDRQASEHFRDCVKACKDILELRPHQLEFPPFAPMGCSHSCSRKLMEKAFHMEELTEKDLTCWWCKEEGHVRGNCQKYPSQLYKPSKISVRCARPKEVGLTQPPQDMSGPFPCQMPARPSLESPAGLDTGVGGKKRRRREQAEVEKDNGEEDAEQEEEASSSLLGQANSGSRKSKDEEGEEKEGRLSVRPRKSDLPLGENKRRAPWWLRPLRPPKLPLPTGNQGRRKEIGQTNAKVVVNKTETTTALDQKHEEGQEMEQE